MTALLAITLLSLLGIVLALYGWIRAGDRARVARFDARTAEKNAHSWELVTVALKRDLADAERRARRRSRSRQPETPAPLPENATSLGEDHD